MTILWFRRDLRIDDNPILEKAKGEVLPIFIFDEELLSTFKKDDRRVSFIFESVFKLKEKLQSIGLDLAIFYGKVDEVFEKISKEKEISKILCSGDNDRASLQRDKKIGLKYNLEKVHDNFLFIPEEILKKDGTPYRVFTPFYKSLLEMIEPLSKVEYKPSKDLKLASYDYPSIDLKNYGFTLPLVDIKSFDVLIEEFKTKVENYKEDRDFLDLEGTSKLGIHLRFGTVSVRKVVREIDHVEFSRQIVWRDFFNYLFVHFPSSEKNNFLDVEPEYINDKEKFEKWKNGETGFPLIDAGMRELKATGNIHNRARMAVASFLTKDLMIDWRWGESYFRETLLDYEASSNVGSWQWAASTGADAVPYFRIFNPFLQSKKFDNEGKYIKKWVPELKSLSPKKIHDEYFFKLFRVEGYSQMIVDRKVSKEMFLKRFKKSDI
ncbi:MAG: DNA photolyase family protein [Campylobacterales bacterium]|nr:DNA photolyase family protein [Campylobacterales bacterium]